MSRMLRCAELQAVQGQSYCKRIFRVMDLPRGMAVPVGWLAVSADVTPLTHYWNAQTKMPIAYPPSPGDGWDFDYAMQAWAPNVQLMWFRVRRERDELLAGCDWRILPDAPTPQEHLSQWLTYRQALRDVTEQPDPVSIQWPTPPA